MKIEQVQDVVNLFFKKTFSTDAEITKVEKTEDGWISEGLIYEDSAFIKSLGLPTRVRDKNTYEIKLNNELEIISYKRKLEKEEEQH